MRCNRLIPGILCAASVAFTTVAQPAQRPRPAGGSAYPTPMAPGSRPVFAGNMAKLLGDNSAFTATMETHTKTPQGEIIMPGKITFLDGKSRVEMDLSQMRGTQISAAGAAQMKQMGMNEIVNISRPDKKESWLVYPGLKAYVALPVQGEQAAGTTVPKSEIQKTEEGKEKIDGHECTRYSVVVKDEQGRQQQLKMWTAADLKDFPVRIETREQGHPATVTFHDVTFQNPEASLFEPPADYTKYPDLPALMRETMMKRFAPPGGLPSAPGK